MTKKSKYLVVSSLLFLGIVGFAVIIVFFAVDNESAVSGHPALDSSSAVRSRTFIKHLRDSVVDNREVAVLSASEDDLNGLVAIGNRSLEWFNGEANISPDECLLTASLHLPHTPLGDYLNLRLKIGPSKSGINIISASAGDISLSGGTSLMIAKFILDRLLGSGQGSAFIDAVLSVQLWQGRIIVRIGQLPELHNRLYAAKTHLKEVRDAIAPLGDRREIQIYYQKLKEISMELPSDRPVSLAEYIGPIFEFAYSRGGSPSDENRSAILAMAIYLGHWRFEQLTGKVRNEDMISENPVRLNVVLAGREDLRLHFIISAGLKIASESKITYAIGELRELMDAGQNGSGFSFVDLAADRAGVRFAKIATDKDLALKFQRFLSENTEESNFFPDISRLPEGLPGQAFKRYFVSIESNIYKTLVSDIDGCINRLPAYFLARSNRALSLPDSLGICSISSVISPEIIKEYPPAIRGQGRKSEKNKKDVENIVHP